MTDRYIAVDLGASSGRVLLGDLSGEKLVVHETRRFENRMIECGGTLYWDALRLLDEMRAGIADALHACLGNVSSVGVDAWGVDFGLLDRRGNLLANPVAYRDARTDRAMESFFDRVGRRRVYEITGIQFMKFNTLFQLHAMQMGRDPLLKVADSLLFMPDLFAHWLCGSNCCEYTIASTSQILDAGTGSWSPELIGALEIAPGLFREIVGPGSKLGKLRGCGFDQERVEVVAPASHDTASAVAAVPARGEGFAFLSCGTWSLMGFESRVPVMTDSSRDLGFTNEGGVFGTYRILKNIMGMWILQECLRSWNDPDLNWDLLLDEVEAAKPFACLLDPDDPCFMMPADMPASIDGFARRTGQEPPQTRAQTARAALESLALAHARTLSMIRGICPYEISRIHMIGGGSRNRLLCQWTADAAGLPVIAGPAEASAAGNILMQAVADGRLGSLEDLRAVSSASFAAQLFEPRMDRGFERAAERFASVCNRGLGEPK